jgi:hypothetical protein
MAKLAENDNNVPQKPDYGTDLKRKPIAEHRQSHGDALIGAVAEGSNNTFYVIRDVSSKYWVEATQLGDHTKARPNPLNLPNSARYVISNLTQSFGLIHHQDEYRKILAELEAEGKEVYIPPEKRGQFDI